MEVYNKYSSKNFNLFNVNTRRKWLPNLLSQGLTFCCAKPADSCRNSIITWNTKMLSYSKTLRTLSDISMQNSLINIVRVDITVHHKALCYVVRNYAIGKIQVHSNQVKDQT